MALPKLFQRIFWHNNTTPAINEDNLNAMSKAIDDIDNRVIVLGDDVITVIPQIQAYLDQAEDLVEAMELLSQNPPYIGQNGNWYVWDTNTSAFVDSGVDASISVNIADITMLAPDATPYVTNTGTDTDPIFHLFIPMGQTGNGISTIAKTGTSGLVDTYTITMTDGTTSTFTVTNGAGDMNKSVYDSDNTVANAGGIKAFVNGEVEDVYEVMGQNGAKNLLPNNATSQVKNGVTFTVNDDGSITVSGTASATAIVELNTEIGLDSTKEYILSGCPSGGSENGYRLDAYEHTAGVGGIGNEYGNGIFVRNKSSIVVRIRVGNGTAITTPITFKPMLRLASDTDSTYQPYAETNQQLTANKVSWDDYSEVGAVNLAQPINSTKVEADTTYTLNEDNSVTITTDAHGSSYSGFAYRVYNAEKLVGKTFKASVGNTAAYGNIYSSVICRETESGSNLSRIDIFYDAINKEAVFTVPANTKIIIFSIGTVSNTYTGAINMTCKPMITPVSYNGPYVPYAMTNRELTEDLANMGLVRTTPNKTTFNITYQGGKSGDMALVITSVGLGTLNFYASAWHWGAFIIVSGTTITESNSSANGLTLTSSGNIGLFLLPLNTEGDKWAITTN
jgi:hypothetical protein